MNECNAAFSEHLLGDHTVGDNAPKDHERQQPTLKEIVTGYPGMRRNLLICILLWFAFSVGYYGMIYSTPPMGLNPALVFAFPALLTLPVLSVSPFLENRLGRRPVIILAMSVGGICGIVTMAIPHDW